MVCSFAMVKSQNLQRLAKSAMVVTRVRWFCTLGVPLYTYFDNSAPPGSNVHDSLAFALRSRASALGFRGFSVWDLGL